MNLKYTIALVIFILTIVGVFIFEKTRIQNSPDMEYFPVTTKVDGNNLYTNKNLGLHFSFPSNWHLGKNTLGDTSGHGYLQLFNYDESVSTNGKESFTKGMNKIEAFITQSGMVATSSDIVEVSRQIRTVDIAGTSAKQFDITLSGNQQYRIYVIPIQSKFLTITIYGDPTNFYVLDDLVQSID